MRRSAPTSRSTGAEPPGGCYTSARYEAGVVRHAHRHAARLRRDAAGFGLEAPDAAALAAALVMLGREAFGMGAGVVRLALRPDPAGGTQALQVGSTRALGVEPASWRAIVERQPHPGPGSRPGAKREGMAIYENARQAASRAGADEALLVSSHGCLIEGARTNVFVVRRDGTLVTPPLARGPVAGIAREIVLECVPEAREDDVPLTVLADAREIVLVNAVRGAVRLEALDGHPIGSRDGHPIGSRDGHRVGSRSVAPWAGRLRALLDSDPVPL